ncbi:MAG: response regulator [Candidatus Omnitrophota bacterium]|nr:response regulator [Candidatus Omnitrophota bacterium]MBU1894674.1 response regulator [Candidatus Omnitrophota bacterium]
MSKRILVVEKNAIMFSVLKDVLEKEGHSVLLSGTGEDAVEKAKSDNPDLVITDTVLPDIDGFEVCRRIKKFKDKLVPKVIITTGDIDSVDAEKAHTAGANDYCARTTDSAHLIRAINELAWED